MTRCLLPALTALWLLGYCSGTPALAGETQTPANQASRPLSPEAIDKKLEFLFERYGKLRHLQARLAQTKSGGLWLRPTTQTGIIKAALPHCFLLDMAEDGTVIVGDGTYIWKHDTEYDEVERFDFKRARQDEESSLGLSAFLFGGAIRTAKEVRRDFAVTATATAAKTRFHLIPKAGKLAESWQSIEFELAADSFIPNYLRMTGKAQEGRKPLVTEQRFSEVQTNLDSLEALPDSTFRFPLSKDLEMSDMDAPKGDRTLSYEQAQQDVAKAMAALAARHEEEGSP